MAPPVSVVRSPVRSASISTSVWRTVSEIVSVRLSVSLLIELYRWIDVERVNAFRDAMAASRRSLEETAEVLAAAYISCAADMVDEFHAVGAALAGSEDKAAVFQELLDNSVQMFVSVLEPHGALPPAELERRCIGLVGAGEALSATIMRGRCREADAVKAFTSLIQGGPLASLR